MEGRVNNKGIEHHSLTRGDELDAIEGGVISEEKQLGIQHVIKVIHQRRGNLWQTWQNGIKTNWQLIKERGTLG